MKKTFILCVGAPKAGTTWLHSYLSRSPKVNLGKMKEYHVWDALTIAECEYFRVKGYLDTFRKHGIYGLPIPQMLLRAKMQQQNGFYEEYFSRLINKSTRITGDITPAYIGLSPDTYKIIKSKIEDRGFVVKVIFLMRDPFQRCWSAMRMDNRRKKITGDESAMLKNLYASPGYVFRTNYKRTILALEEVYDGNQIYYGIYEEMFNPDKIEALSKFVGVNPVLDHATHKVNESPKRKLISKDLIREIKSFYNDVYEYCYQRFPQTINLWTEM